MSIPLHAPLHVRLHVLLRARTACIAACLLLPAAAAMPGSAHATAPGDWVTVYDAHSDDGTRVHLDRLPQRTPAIDGVLAMIAFQQTPIGCEGPRDALDCPITRELGLGLQCSDAHVAIVQTGFPERMPKLGGYHESRYSGFEGKGPDASMCAQTPESASVQSHLSSVRIRQAGRRLTVESRVVWHARERSGETVYRTRLRVDGDRVVPVSNTVIRAK